MNSRDPNRIHLIELADLLAKVLDTTVKIPGTSLYLAWIRTGPDSRDRRCDR